LVGERRNLPLSNLSNNRDIPLPNYTEFSNEKRPHQGLLNYSPGYMHTLGNNSKLPSHYRQIVQDTKEERIKINQFTAVSN
jgi:hypothetical protein